VDLKGRALVPGFVDAHGHIVNGGLQALSANLLAPPDCKVQDIPSLLLTLRAWKDDNAAAVAKTKLILGMGYDNTQIKEQRHLSRYDGTGPV
jgi:predicted amidohydrolase YtcJ